MRSSITIENDLSLIVNLTGYHRFFVFMFNCKQPMTPVEIRAAHRISAALLKQSKEKMRDQQQNLAKAEA